MKQPTGMDKIKGVMAAIPNNPYFDLMITQRRLRFENTFFGLRRLNNPVLRLNQSQNDRIPELKYIKTIIPKVPEVIPNNSDSVKDNFSFKIKNGTVIANLNEAINAAMIVSSQFVSIIISRQMQGLLRHLIPVQCMIWHSAQDPLHPSNILHRLVNDVG